ncbi:MULTISPECIES: phage major capsid protein [unclassified Aurantimonas]|uniref:phage major capsid protein n=1 Tax=unclassified Aurantimonas TaxID=2638230 RepID=UPI002E1724A0|nr:MULTISPECIES: phage major capsid protein [unclassified Aurantimonas]MEC5291585.1 phage major capsid protein [Aurantimonas sp. C2-3-R2]MEC5412669.1 phage major capsid protein [Aurantimonas sp. C2-4-R8]
MAFTADEITNINNSALEVWLDKGKLWKQNTANKPMLAAFNQTAGKFSGGNLEVSVGVKGVGHEGALAGYTHDDQVGYYNPTNGQRAKYPWKEHHIGTVITHTELKIDGIDVVEDSADQTTREMSGREEHVLADLLDEKMDDLGEDYAYSLDLLVHSDGTADAKALAGIGSLILDVPTVGSTGGISRVANPYWANRAATVANGVAGGQGAITSATANGGALVAFLDKEARFRNQFKNGQTKQRQFAGSDFIDAYKAEMRANGYYTQTGWGDKKPDGSMQDPNHAGVPFEWDPTLDALGLSKRCYFLDMGKTGIRLLYMDGQRMKKHHPARPYDRYVMYNGITMTGVMVAKQLNTSGVYDIA